MASKNFSASRLKCFEGCRLNYKYKYIDGWQAIGKPENDLQGKGLCLHETFEHYHTGMTNEDAIKLLEENMKEHPVDEEKFNVREGLNRFFVFWDQFVKPLESAGYNIEKETWVKATIENEPFIGAIDLFLGKETMDLPDEIANDLISKGIAKASLNETPPEGLCMKVQILNSQAEEVQDLIKKGYKLDGKIRIIDYKTASSIGTTGYRSQLLLYAYMIGLNRGWDCKQIAENVELYVFFPLGKVTAKSANTPEKQALNCIRQIDFNAMDVDENADHFIADVKAIKEQKWDEVSTDDAETAFACRWCDYAGSIENGEFKGCPKSYALGYRQLRKVHYEKEIKDNG